MGVAGKARPSTESERTRRCVSAERRAQRAQRRPGGTAVSPATESSKRLLVGAASMLSRWRYPPKRTLLPRVKGIYHVGCTDYPDPTYPW